MQAFNEAVRTGTKEGKIRIETPLIALRKAEIVTLGLELGAPFDLTWSCYSREDQACGSLRQLCVANAGLCGGGSQRSHSLFIAGRSALILRNSNSDSDIAVATWRRNCTSYGPIARAGGKHEETSHCSHVGSAALLGLCAMPACGAGDGHCQGSLQGPGRQAHHRRRGRVTNTENGRKIRAQDQQEWRILRPLA